MFKIKFTIYPRYSGNNKEVSQNQLTSVYVFYEQYHKNICVLHRWIPVAILYFLTTWYEEVLLCVRRPLGLLSCLVWVHYFLLLCLSIRMVACSWKLNNHDVVDFQNFLLSAILFFIYILLKTKKWQMSLLL